MTFRLRTVFVKIFRFVSVGVLYILALPAVRKWLLEKLTGRKTGTNVIDVNVKK